jgi:hypothetical protein
VTAERLLEREAELRAIGSPGPRQLRLGDVDERGR